MWHFLLQKLLKSTNHNQIINSESVGSNFLSVVTYLDEIIAKRKKDHLILRKGTQLLLALFFDLIGGFENHFDSFQKLFKDTK